MKKPNYLYGMWHRHLFFNNSPYRNIREVCSKKIYMIYTYETLYAALK